MLALGEFGAHQVVVVSGVFVGPLTKYVVAVAIVASSASGPVGIVHANALVNPQARGRRCRTAASVLSVEIGRHRPCGWALPIAPSSGRSEAAGLTRSDTAVEVFFDQQA